MYCDLLFNTCVYTAHIAYFFNYEYIFLLWPHEDLLMIPLLIVISKGSELPRVFFWFNWKIVGLNHCNTGSESK